MLILSSNLLAFTIMDFGLATVCAVVGAGAGWWLSGLRTTAQESQAADQAQLVIERLKLLATSMAANVDEHTSRVQEINTDLKMQSVDGAEAVVNSITKIMEANSQMQNKLQEAESRLEEQAVEIETQFTAARTDQLTGVANRRAFDDTLDNCYKLWTKKGVPFSTLLIDVDHFKKFNDTYGHQAGDAVLVGVAGALSGAMRDKDIVARYGGEEFAVIFPQTKIEDAMPAAERARRAIEESVFSYDGQELQVAASVGLAQIRGDDTADLVVKNADAALYTSKDAGRNCSHYHDGEKFIPLTPRVRQAKKEAVKKTVTSEPETSPTGSTAFENELRRRVAECQRFDVPLSIMRIRVDEFDARIREIGPGGDRLVMDVVGEVLNGTLREMDLATETHKGQVSVMLPGSEVGDAAGVAERLRKTIAGRALGDNSTAQITVSIGLSQVVPCDDVSALLARADEALDASRSASGNCSHQHDGKQLRPIDGNVA